CTALARKNPVNATAKDTSGAPATEARDKSGESTWEKASRPHGKPPKGHTCRSCSATTQLRANSGACSHRLSRIHTPRRIQVQAATPPAMIAASATESAAHGMTPTA